jgi:hypothetical protein
MLSVRLVMPTLLVVGLAILGRPASAQNHVTNPEFHTGLHGWVLLSKGSSASFWSATDAGGRPDSGSVLMAGVSTPGGPETFGYLYSRADKLTPLTEYVLGGYVSVDRSSNGASDVRFGIDWNAGEPCFIGTIRSDWGPGIPEGIPWTPWLWRLFSPPGATTACIYLYGSNGHASFAARLDNAYLGAPGGGPDLIFKDDFESGDMSAWSAAMTDGGDLSVSGAAALVGSFGLEGSIDDKTAIYVQDDTPSDENRYVARFLFDPNGFDPGEASGTLRTRIFIAFEENPTRRLIAIILRRLDGQYAIQARVRQDDDSQFSTSFLPITDESHVIEFEWSRSTRPEAPNGKFVLTIDRQPAVGMGGLDNDISAVDFVRLGAPNVKAGASGTLYFDHFESRRLTPIE